MSSPEDIWANAFARQADVDLKIWEERDPPLLVAHECHRLLLLQMACEKLAKAHLLDAGNDSTRLQKSHAVIRKHLPLIIEQTLRSLDHDPRKWRELLRWVRQLSGEIELLNPAIQRSNRPDNCEYPWEVAGQIFSPIDHSFNVTSLLGRNQYGPTFFKLLRVAIDNLLRDQR
jgi:hypothetical protein